MSVLLTIAAVCCLADAGPAAVDDQGAAWAIIDRAVQAHGGREKVMGFKAGTWKGQGTVEIQTGSVPFEIEWSIEFPQRVRTALTLGMSGQKLTYLTVLDNDRGWMQMGTVTTALNPAALAEAQEQLYATRLAMLAPLQDRSFKLSVLGENEVDDQAAVGVRVSREGHRDVDLYFSKQTGLRLKSEYRVRDELTGQQVKQENIYAAYKDFDGVKQPLFTTIKRAGKQFLVVQLAEYWAEDKLGEDLFREP